MGALTGKHNVLELIRINKSPYWRIYQSDGKRQSGNFINQADFADTSLDLDKSIESLRWTLDGLSTGTYLLVAFSSRDKTKGGIDTIIEIENRNGHAPVAGIGSLGGFHIDGFGPVTPENFENAIEAKMKKLLEDQQRAAELQRLKEENARLQRELNDSEGGFKKGVISIGSVLYENIKDTPSGKEFIGMAQKLLYGNGKSLPAPAASVGAKAAVNGPGEEDTDEEKRVAGALEKLAKDNPDFIGQLEKLANLKENDPHTFELAVDSLNSTT